jgi:hypothetical protein
MALLFPVLMQFVLLRNEEKLQMMRYIDMYNCTILQIHFIVRQATATPCQIKGSSSATFIVVLRNDRARFLFFLCPEGQKKDKEG